jgi:hypothetical protein
MMLDTDSLEHTKEVLIWLYVLATIGVIIGVYMEGERFSERTKLLGWRILLLSLATETLFGTLIFATDGRISRIQRSEIIALETKLSPRTLSNPEAAELAALLKPFGGQEFTIGSYGGEAAALASRLRTVLEKADWKWFDPEYQILPLAGTVGIQVWARSQGSHGAAKPLVDTLNGRWIEAMLLPDQPDNPNDNKIEIIVGSKF